MTLFKGAKCDEGLHKFEPRYDEGAVKLDSEDRLKTNSLEMLAMLRPKTYVHDICVVCGTTVRRDGSVVPGKKKSDT